MAAKKSGQNFLAVTYLDPEPKKAPRRMRVKGSAFGPLWCDSNISDFFDLSLDSDGQEHGLCAFT